MKRLFVFLCSLALLLAMVWMADAALIDRGGGLIYDEDQDITWLQDANYACTSGYDSDGHMTWHSAVGWAEGLEYYDMIRNVTWTDWRLPSTVDGPYTWGYEGLTTAGHNITTSEMGYMYFVNLENLSFFATDGTNPQLGWGLNNTGPFYNLESIVYWSETQYSLDAIEAWHFSFYSGNQTTSGKGYITYAWAVMDGDVSTVPIPSSLWLLGSGLIGLVGFRKKSKWRK